MAKFFSQPKADQNIPRGSVQSFKSARAFTDESITPEVSLTVPAVLAAFTILSEDISSLPLLLYAQRGKNKFRAYDQANYTLLKDQPNSEHTSMVFREIMMGHLLGWGNFYGQLITDRKGQVTEIWPLRPDRMEVMRVEGQKVYRYTQLGGKPRAFVKDEIMHIPAFSFDGLIGYSRIAMMRNAIGLSRAAENFGSKFFKNDARPGVVLKSKKKLTPDAQKNLRESFMDVYAGQDNRWKVGILEEDLDIATIGLPPEDSQFLQTRQFQLGEIARAFRVPPHMIGDVDRSTSWGSGIDAQEQGYVTHTLRPWTTRIEECLNAQILLPEERTVYFYEHLFADLLRGDLATRYEAYVKAINNGIMNRNEVRSRENLNPYTGGDDFMMPANMVTLNSKTAADGNSTSATNALEPIWQDAIKRVVRRELNDLGGAARRHLAKNHVPAYQKWNADFYGKDHPQFISDQFAPVIEAQARLFHLNVDLSETVNNYLTMRQMLVRDMSAEEIEENIETWQQHLPAYLLSAVLKTVQEEALT